MRIGIVGPCASGKSLLVTTLRAQGYDAHQCSQEHSYVADMWRRICKPDVLIYLDASLHTIRQRRQIDWGLPYLTVLQARLVHARQHCDLYIQTDGLAPDDVCREVQRFFELLESKERN